MNASKVPKKKTPNKRKKPMPAAPPSGAVLAPASSGDGKGTVFCVLNFLSFPQIFLSPEKLTEKKPSNFAKLQFLNDKV